MLRRVNPKPEAQETLNDKVKKMVKERVDIKVETQNEQDKVFTI